MEPPSDAFFDDMEVILQWLDDLDDLVCAFAQVAERSRWPSLQIAFGAALSLAAARFAALPDLWEPLLSSVSVGGLTLWAVGSWVVARHATTLVAAGTEIRPSA